MTTLAELSADLASTAADSGSSMLVGRLVEEKSVALIGLVQTMAESGDRAGAATFVETTIHKLSALGSRPSWASGWIHIIGEVLGGGVAGDGRDEEAEVVLRAKLAKGLDDLKPPPTSSRPPATSPPRLSPSPVSAAHLSQAPPSPIGEGAARADAAGADTAADIPIAALGVSTDPDVSAAVTAMPAAAALEAVAAAAMEAVAAEEGDASPLALRYWTLRLDLSTSDAEVIHQLSRLQRHALRGNYLESVTASGAGVSACNGVYTRDGEYSGSPVFKHSGGAWWMLRYDMPSGRKYWYIADKNRLK